MRAGATAQPPSRLPRRASDHAHCSCLVYVALRVALNDWGADDEVGDSRSMQADWRCQSRAL
eukprot:2455292-Prymnesium_polylepis.2